ncbi:MAG: TldD/PmbA family protein, partial [Candidatus Aminicenantes bacterium]|nr:TldD/PmbA family protein [Candidatus Aminicenantes bacterium]
MKKATPALRDLAESLVVFARRCGADEAEVSVSDGYEFNVDVRRGRIETLIEAGARVCGVRVIKNKNTAFASSSDLDPGTLKRLIRNAVRRSELGNPDKFAGLAPLSKESVDAVSLKLYDPAIAGLDSKTKIGLALATEKAALRDKRITNSYGATFASNEIRSVLAISNGFVGEYAQTYCGLGVGLQAGNTDNRVEDSWSSSKRHFKDLESPEAIARKAVERTVRQLKPRKVKTQNVPVIFEPTQTAWLMGFLFGCVTGTAVFRKATFLEGKLGQRIGNRLVTVVDDGIIPGELGSHPFDSDGLPSRRTVVIKKGVLKNYLCNHYAARKLGLKSTGNADGNGVGPNNFYLEPGTTSPKDIVAGTKRGLILIRTLGHGLNSVTGDISRGAFGLWVEDGEVVYPVSEVTISGNLGRILEGIEAVGNDLEFHSPVTGPTVKVAEMTVAG